MEQVIYELAREFYPDYPVPMPEFRYQEQLGKGLLESALAQPRQTFQGRFLYKTIFDKAATLFHSVIKNHALIDGNKRLALATVTVFLTLNGYLFYPGRSEAVTFALRVAAEQDGPSLREIASWFRRHSISHRRFLSMSEDQAREWLAVVRRSKVAFVGFLKIIRRRLDEMEVLSVSIQAANERQ